MAKKQVNNISDKLAKVNDSFSVQMYDNGFMFEIGGKDSDGDWKNAKIMCSTIDQLVALVKEATELERDE
jgi:hypothetical protein